MECRNYIGGEWTDLGQVEMREIRNPANTDEIVGHCPMAQREHVQQAVDAAAEAFPSWRALTHQERAKLIERASDVLEAKADEIGRILTREEGKTFAEARGEVIHGADLLRSYASLARQAWGGVFSPPNRAPFSAPCANRWVSSRPSARGTTLSRFHAVRYRPLCWAATP